MKTNSEVLTAEDKKYLRKFTRYLQSYEIQIATIRLLELDYCEFRLEDVDFDNITHLSNNYSVEIPDGLKPILKKVLESGMHKVDDFDCPDHINYGGVDIEISCKNQEINAVFFVHYYDSGDSEGLSWSVEENPEIKNILDEISENNGKYEPIMKVTYDGGGDSGYVEDRFENGESVPARVQDWCERELSNNFGGWEINEGSYGFFVFDLERNEIELIHTYNIDESKYMTLSEFEFGK